MTSSHTRDLGQERAREGSFGRKEALGESWEPGPGEGTKTHGKELQC